MQPVFKNLWLKMSISPSLSQTEAQTCLAESLQDSSDVIVGHLDAHSSTSCQTSASRYGGRGTRPLTGEE